MVDSRKPLHPYEQSMLLVAMLFDSKNLNEILSFLPSSQSERMQVAQEKFLKLSRNERMTQIVFELRRLLLIDEHRIDWIHQSWIEDALAKEPPYLRPIIEQALRNGSQKKSPASSRSFVPLPLIFSMFIDQLINTPQKTAIYDPVLMRLQSLKDEAQEDVFAIMGMQSLSLLNAKMDARRFRIFLEARGLREALPELSPVIKNPFEDQTLRAHYVKELRDIKPGAKDCALLAGLLTTALYLLPFKHHWQRTIALGLQSRIGLLLEQMIGRGSSLTIEKGIHRDLSGLMIASLDQIRR